MIFYKAILTYSFYVFYVEMKRSPVSEIAVHRVFLDVSMSAEWQRRTSISQDRAKYEKRDVDGISGKKHLAKNEDISVERNLLSTFSRFVFMSWEIFFLFSFTTILFYVTYCARWLENCLNRCATFSSIDLRSKHIDLSTTRRNFIENCTLIAIFRSELPVC